jgi:adsorption protein B
VYLGSLPPSLLLVMTTMEARRWYYRFDSISQRAGIPEISHKIVHSIFTILIAIAAIGFFLSGCDDLFIDLYYWIRRFWRALFFRKRIRPVTEKDLSQVPEQWTAIWIPAWHEAGVIDKMLLNTMESLNFRNYDIFVGTYPNDDETQLAVEGVREHYRQVHKIVCPDPGPTNKADCLNWVFQGMLLVEEQKGIRYEIVVLHDSEDIVHPLELKLFNWLIPHKDMVQLPVIPLEMPASNWTAGTYLDEFAENHSKDLLVRELLAEVIPSAGVGTGLSRVVLDELAERRHNRIFNTNSVTEDYEFGFSLLGLKRKGILAQFDILRPQTVTRGLWRRKKEVRMVRERIAVREFFPDRFSLAVRQKSRWILGISLQGWKHLGWKGSFWIKYMFYRDRKALLTNVLNVLGYTVIPYWIFGYVRYQQGMGPRVVESSWLWNIILIDTVFMVHRFGQRIVAVKRISGWTQALLSVPRLAVGNAINFAATIVAIRQFFAAERSGSQVAWQKTAHAFPSTKQLREHRRRLGDLLLENRLLSVAQLRNALAQQKSGEKLGNVVTRLGYLSEEDMVTVLGRQLGVPVCSIDYRLIEQKWLKKFSREVAERLHTLPLRSVNGTLEIACENPNDAELGKQLRDIFGCPVQLQLATETDLQFAISRAYLNGEGHAGSSLGVMLVKAGHVTKAELDQALQAQKRSGQKLGEVLQDLGLISAEKIVATLKAQQVARQTEK